MRDEERKAAMKPELSSFIPHPSSLKILERETGFEPATSTLARSHSTTELLPLSSFDYKQAVWPEQRRAANQASRSSLLLRTGKQIRDT